MRKKIPFEELISLSEAAKKRGMNPGFLRNLCLNGRLKGKKIGRNWVTTRRWLDEYLDSRSEINIPKKYRNGA